ncbi:regulatory particle non-ATPase [Yamadazyma tenuis]|uniref:C2H2-type domain-containing protein n=1 Tax=Candida tenuis (strain ATCC 10573 / BCRC 21748 / CBS 615 / JCM 9827 / NBRC 10315 / NRRL Y-1498 / VKM Y-70) TaxID=590646 RepID=G3B4C8_CANTC|nr:uncharacterized protein CANTEDRAFT_93460 [Yamadazyma tenuis ATCC 10573]EGV63952.1 hypothetical protein CANTEDRAFT_93460 [Yamadazyma tenuis ATCC 10573]WEJ96432.1 regulatory particle non-ATPase [Yamadazyma tenuis]
MTSIIIPQQKSIIDLIDEELYTVPNSPILNHSSPVYNPLFSGSSNYFQTSSRDTSSAYAATVAAATAAFTTAQLQAPTPLSAPLPVAVGSSSATSPSSAMTPQTPGLFNFNNLNKPQNNQKIFNDYSDPEHSFIQPNRLMRAPVESANPQSPQTQQNITASVNPFKARSRAKSMKIKTLSPPPAGKFDDLFDPNSKPSSSFNFDFENDNDSIFVHHHTNNSSNRLNEPLKNLGSDEITTTIDFNDYNDYEFDELDDMSDYESDDDNLFDYYDENDIYNGNVMGNDDSTPLVSNEMNGFNDGLLGDYTLKPSFNNDDDSLSMGVKLTDLNDQIDLEEMDTDLNDLNDSLTQENVIDDDAQDDDDDSMDIDIGLDEVHSQSSDSSFDKHDADGLSEKKTKKKYDEILDHHCNLINPNTGVPCNKQFSRPYDLIRHQETIHAAKKKIFRCVICEGRYNGGKGNGKSKTFSRGDALSRHIKVKHQLVGQEALELINDAKENAEFVSV